MKDDEIKKIFQEYDPELSSDYLFINRLKRNLDSVEIIKKHNSEQRKIYKKAVYIAVFTGFIVGFMLALFIPQLEEIIMNMKPFVDYSSSLTISSDSLFVILWLIVGSVSVIFSYNAYELSIFLMKSKDGNKSPFQKNC